MKDNRPNILLLMADQQRGDCLGIEGHPVLQTPHLDYLAATGVRFSRAYSACPVCIPARRTLMTGRKPANHGVLMNYHTWLDGPTMPGELSKAGYQTHLVGKLHLWPKRKLYGFNSADWADSPHERERVDDDYIRFLRREGITETRPGVVYGAHWNGWNARPWHLEERLHFSNWCAQSAMDFLERRDPTVPFFLKVSFHQPHQPCTPPQVYWDRYMNMDLPEPYVGQWAKVFDKPQRGLPIDSWRTALEPVVMKQYRAGYYGTINHIDDQIGRILKELPVNTIVIFISDHGDMLGDHQWIRKRTAYEPSARIPFLIRFPQEADIEQGRVIDEVVELMDIMPTVLEACGISIPETVDGMSLFPLLRKQNIKWRRYLHGECCDIPSLNSGMQYLTDGKKKYIWFPGSGTEQYFDLQADPREMTNLAGQADCRDEIEYWRSVLISELAGRPEGFTDGKQLKVLGKPTPAWLPGYEQQRFL
ncbi:MAG: arylsulfatase [Deltaproteobacteria bacterium]|nr:arylsulfatase [Deltaproteobacteria bacterium]MBW1960667.1 arylsulfatase [Deltaproteobacteria bacterium]MBW2152056.1 arylsulfatase [Deltaproteobacteria bacterium]